MSNRVSDHDKNVIWDMYMRGYSITQIKTKLASAKYFLDMRFLSRSNPAMQTGQIETFPKVQICKGKSVSNDSQASTNDRKDSKDSPDNVVTGYTGRN